MSQPAAEIRSMSASRDAEIAGNLERAAQSLDAARHLRPLEDLESEIIRFAIAHYRGQMSEVARRLRIGRSTLYRKLDGLSMEPENRPETVVSVAPE